MVGGSPYGKAPFPGFWVGSWKRLEGLQLRSRCSRRLGLEFCLGLSVVDVLLVPWRSSLSKGCCDSVPFEKSMMILQPKGLHVVFAGVFVAFTLFPCP